MPQYQGVGPPFEMTLEMDLGPLDTLAEDVLEKLSYQSDGATKEVAEQIHEFAQSLIPRKTGTSQAALKIKKIGHADYLVYTEDAPHLFFFEVGFRHSGVITDPDGTRRFFPKLVGAWFHFPFMRPSLIVHKDSLQNALLDRIRKL